MSAPIATPEPGPYEAVVGMAERELELAVLGRYTEMAQLAHQREQLLAILPSPPPANARDPLSRALLIQRRVSIELLRAREHVLLALRRIELTRRTAHGYGRSTGEQPRPSVHAEG